MPRKAAAFMLACVLASSSVFAQTRIASTSLCGDAYLLALAPERAAALSWQSKDPVSRANAAQRDLPQVWDNAERLLGLKAEKILFGPGEGLMSDRYISKTPLTTYTLTWGEDFDAVIKNYAGMGKALGIETPALDAASHLETRLSRLRTRNTGRGHIPNVLYISRAGGTAGAGTYVDAAITAAGGQNVVEDKGWVTLDAEYILNLSPDFIVTSFMADGYESVNANGLRHKILREFISAHPKVNVPGSLWPCAGPGLIEAAELIADGLDKAQ